MTKKSARSPSDGMDNLAREIQVTRVVWNDEMKLLNANAREFAVQLRTFAKNMFDSPLGKRAQRHPIAAITVASLAAVLCLRFLRR